MRVTRSGMLKAVLLLVVLLLAAAAFLWFRCGLRGCPDVGSLAGYVPDQASVVLDRKDREVGKLYRIERVVVPLDSLPRYVSQAFVAIEDQRFWQHHGVDWRRVPGAILANLKAGGVEQGFSTITMQLARNVFPEKLPASQRTIWRKLGEMRVAQQIEDRYDKREILGMYLNQIYFGAGAWGIEAAAEAYFGEPASQLTLAQAALLAALPVAPARYNPRRNPDGARERRDLVLQKMASQGMISRERARAARDEDLKLARRRTAREEAAPYFMDAVRQRLEDRFGDALYTGGYRIHTTLDLDIQRVAEQELKRQLDAIEAGRYGRYAHARYDADADSVGSGSTPYLQGSIVVLDAGDGGVLALVGGRDFDQSEYDRALQARRQVGSAFKPFVYAAALARGYPPTLAVEDTPLSLRVGNSVWAPRNYGNVYSGRIPMREALVHSKNVATVRIAERVGLEDVIGTAHSLGIDERLPPYPSVALGSIGVPLLQLVAAYAAFASLGDRPEPRFVDRVEGPDGSLVWQEPVRRDPVLDPAVAFVLTTMLQDVVDRGTATAVRATGYRGAAAGKTGTTNDGTDAWFVGYTPRLVAGIWIGLDDPATIVPGATGGALAAPVWGRVMRRIGAGGSTWSPPPGVTTLAVDTLGDVVGEGCPAYGPVHEEYFVRGTTPLSTTCTGPGYAYGDTFGAYGDTLGVYGDTLGADTAEDGWWERFRRRIFGAGRDTADRARNPRADSALPRAPAPSMPLPDTAPRARRDSARLDSIRRAPPPDTARARPPPPDTTRARPTPPDTTRPDTTGADTARGAPARSSWPC